MQIAYHIGAHCTDEDRLLKSVLRNVDLLLNDGVAVPGPGRYRSLIRNTIQGLDGAHPPQGTRDILLDSILDDDAAQRVILSNNNFICVPNRIFEHGIFYPQAETKARALAQLFPDDDLTLFMGIRHPATFLQDAVTRSKAVGVGDFMGIMRPIEMRWHDVIRRIKSGAPDAHLVVWCNEDTPILWGRLIRALAGATFDAPITGDLDMLAGLMRRAGIARLQEQLTITPPATERERQTMIADFWEAYAIPESDDDDVTLPELDMETVAQMTENYEADLSDIAEMDGVTLILPFQ